MIKSKLPPTPKGSFGGENLDKIALDRAVLGRMPGEKSLNTSFKPIHETSLSKPKKF